MIGAERRQQIGLRERDHPSANAEQPEHVEVLGGLRHRSLVRRGAKDRDVDAESRSDHGAQEPFVARDVDDSGGPDCRQLEVRVPRFQGDATPFLFRKAIRVDSRERLHQRRLPVVDMACGPDDDAQRGCCVHSSTQAIPGASLPRSSAASPLITATGAAQ